MATLDSSDFQNIKKRIKNSPAARAEFKAWGLSKPTWYALFQAVEDWFVNGFLTAPSNSFKDEAQTITGTCTNSQAKQVGFVWMGWRYAKNP